MIPPGTLPFPDFQSLKTFRTRLIKVQPSWIFLRPSTLRVPRRRFGRFGIRVAHVKVRIDAATEADPDRKRAPSTRVAQVRPAVTRGFFVCGKSKFAFMGSWITDIAESRRTLVGENLDTSMRRPHRRRPVPGGCGARAGAGRQRPPGQRASCPA